MNVYSGFYDQLGPEGQLGTNATDAISRLVDSDANTYLVYVPALNVAPDGSIAAGARTISDQHLIEAARYGSTAGAVAVLKPQIPDPTNVAASPAVVDSYAVVLRHYGEVATQMGAKVFVIATELTNVYRDPAAMNALLDAATSTYHVPGGQLAVSINWDQLHEALSFRWLDRVRLVGIDGYWPLGSAGAVGDAAAIESQWSKPGFQTDGASEPAGRTVSALGATGHQVVFSEIGYPRCSGAVADPSAQPDPGDPGSCGESVDAPEAQRMAAEAAYCYWTRWSRQHGDPAWFHGLWWWDMDLSKAPNVWDVATARGAESVIRAWNVGDGQSCRDPESIGE